MQSLRKCAQYATALVIMAAAASTASAEGRAQGGIVIRDNAPIYSSDEGDTLEMGVGRVSRGFPVAGVTVIMGKTRTYMAETENGRIHILYLGDGKNRNALRHRAWMDPADVAFFTYECGCGARKEPCAPVMTAGWTSERWNPCFQEAYDRKLAELKASWDSGHAAPVPVAASGRPHSAAREAALTNADVVSLFKAGLGEDLVLSKIQQAPSESLDVSVDALLQLKKEGISKQIIDAMLRRTSQRGASMTSASSPAPIAAAEAKPLTGGIKQESGLRRVVPFQTAKPISVDIADGPVNVASLEVLAWPTADVLQRAEGKIDAVTQLRFKITSSNSEKATAKYFCQIAALDAAGNELGVGEEIVSIGGRETAETHRVSLKMKLAEFSRVSQLRLEIARRPN